MKEKRIRKIYEYYRLLKRFIICRAFFYFYIFLDKGDINLNATKTSKRSSLLTKEKITNLKEIDKITDNIKELFNSVSNAAQLKILTALGVGETFFTCQRCGKVKNKDKFYVSTATGVASGITNICKQCAEEIAMPVVNGEKQLPTKESVDDAMYALDKPMLESVWDASLLEAANTVTNKAKSNVYTAYCKNIAMPQYYHDTYRNSDNYTGGLLSLEAMEKDALPKDQEIIEQFEKNKNDTLRLLGYLPFEKEKIGDQPFLYSQLIGFLDSSEEGNDDMMRTASVISIVRGFLQASNIDDMVAQLSQDFRNAEKNISTIKSLQQMKAQILGSVNNLAKESCISLKNSKHSIKGENTWTGKIQKIKDLNLREGRVNGFDIATCRGMQQVQEISDASIMKQLALDESEWSDMVATMRIDNQELRRQRDAYKEINRLLLQENLDLKDYMSESGITIKDNLHDLKEVYSPFSDENIEDDVEGVEGVDDV